MLEKLNQHTNQQALTNSIEEGLRIQAQNRLQRMLKQQLKKAAEAAAQQETSASSAEQEREEKAAPKRKTEVEENVSEPGISSFFHCF